MGPAYLTSAVKNSDFNFTVIVPEEGAQNLARQDEDNTQRQIAPQATIAERRGQS